MTELPQAGGSVSIIVRTKEVQGCEERAAMNLPIEFIKRMQDMLQDEYESFASSYNRPRRPGLRSNTLKDGIERFEKSGLFGMEEVPWAPHGFFYEFTRLIISGYGFSFSYLSSGKLFLKLQGPRLSFISI